MKKFNLLITFIFILIFGTIGSVNCYAMNSSVTYGTAEEFIFNPTSTDLFSEFKNVMPGDTRTQLIALSNARPASNATIYLRAEVFNNKEFLNFMTISVYWGDSETGTKNLITKNKASEEGLLLNDVKLKTLKPGETDYIYIELYIDEQMNNKFKLNEGSIKWIFSCEEEKILIKELTTKNNEEKPTNGGNVPGTKLPFTGSRNTVMIVFPFFLSSIIIFIYLTKKMKRKTKYET